MLNKVLCAGYFRYAIRNFERDTLHYLFHSRRELFIASRRFEKNHIFQRQDLSLSYVRVHSSGPLSVDLVKVKSYTKVAPDKVISLTLRTLFFSNSSQSSILSQRDTSLRKFICNIPIARVHTGCTFIDTVERTV